MAILQKLQGLLQLRDAWPKLEANDEALNAELAEQKQRVDNLILSGDSGPEAADARVDGVTGKSFAVLKDRLDNTSLNLRTMLDDFYGTQMVAHRGLMNLAPENTIPAFELAARHGFKFIEMDVSPTSDGALIICHDSTVDAMTDGTGTISAMTYAQIQALNVDAGANIANYPGTKLCVLEDVLKIAVKYNLIPIIELKNIPDQNANCDAIYTLLKKYNMVSRVIVTSVNQSWLNYMRSLDASIYLGYLNDTWSTTNIDYVKSLVNALYICNRLIATSDNITYCHNNRVRMMIYSPTGTGSIDFLSEQFGYTALGVDFILTGSLLQRGD